MLTPPTTRPILAQLDDGSAHWCKDLAEADRMILASRALAEGRKAESEPELDYQENVT